MVKFGGHNLNGLHPIRLVEFDQSNFKFDWALNTGQIGWKFTEITLYACLVELGVNPLRLNCLLKALVVIISMDLHPIQPVESQIRPGIKYWLN